ncbi:MAG: carboxylesterase family protein [Flavobacteriales bacterium]|nr:carboxylesterase family protein [Flavobacteriales bacterium]
MRSSLILPGLALPALLMAQTECGNGRYTDPALFDSLTVTLAVPFGANTGVGGTLQTLYMDVYAPVGDTLSERPVVLVAFGGSFVAGSRADVAEICEAFAHRGYVAVAPDYRVGFFFPNATTTQQAVMRGAHDMRACVRFLRKTVAEDGNPYGIDVDRIIVGGVSAGAIAAIHATYLDQPAELPAVLVPDSAALGGIEGNSGTPTYSSEVLACFSYSGAIGDTSWIVPGDQPLVSVHEAGDAIVPCYTQEVSVFGIPTGLIASGSAHIHQHAEAIGLEHCFLLYPGNGHVGYFNTDPQGSEAIVVDFLANVVCGQPASCGLQAASVTEEAVAAPLAVFPNPSTGRFTVTLAQATILDLFDATGRLVFSTTEPTGDRVLDLDLGPGTYLLRDRMQPGRVTRILIQER